MSRGAIGVKNQSVPRYGKLYSVTQLISGALGKAYQYVPQDVMQAASERGRKVHNLTHLYDMGHDYSNTDIEFHDYLNSYIEWRRHFPWDLVDSEIPLRSIKYGFAGTPDKRFKKIYRQFFEHCVVDVKTRLYVPKYDKLQVTAYSLLYRELFNVPITYKYILSIVRTKKGIRRVLTDVPYDKVAEKLFIAIISTPFMDKRELPKELVRSIDRYMMT